MTNTGWQNWAHYQFKGIQVSGGRCAVGVLVDGQTGDWGNVDDIECLREEGAQ